MGPMGGHEGKKLMEENLHIPIFAALKIATG
jgi:hypothetical protein